MPKGKCNWDVAYDGKQYLPGDDIDIESKEIFNQLAATGAVSPLTDKKSAADKVAADKAAADKAAADKAVI
jgi:hypothetical protein